MLCGNTNTVPGKHKGQTENHARRRELRRARQSSLFAAKLGDGDRLHVRRAEQRVSIGRLAGGPQKVSGEHDPPPASWSLMPIRMGLLGLVMRKRILQ
jgi:hypothetical protein